MTNDTKITSETHYSYEPVKENRAQRRAKAKNGVKIIASTKLNYYKPKK